MSDIALVFDPVTGAFDIALDGPDLLMDDGLETAVIVSLFTNRRADPDDVLPDEPSSTGRRSGDRQGWWGDWYSDDALAAFRAGVGTLQPPTDRCGSRRWLLAREKQTGDVLQRVVDYDKEALQWMIDDGVAAAVDVLASYPARGVLREEITITRPDGTAANYQFDTQWAALAKALGL
jgi:phage gp46-like protein